MTAKPKFDIALVLFILSGCLTIFMAGAWFAYMGYHSFEWLRKEWNKARKYAAQVTAERPPMLAGMRYPGHEAKNGDGAN